MEVYRVAKMGRPKSANPKNTLIGLKLTEEEATKLKEYASRHDHNRCVTKRNWFAICNGRFRKKLNVRTLSLRKENNGIFKER